MACLGYTPKAPPRRLGIRAVRRPVLASARRFGYNERAAMDLVEVELARVVIHQKGDQQYIHLRERHGNRGFPIVIGFHEVEEINRKLSGMKPPRPLTHDLIGRIVSALDHRILRVVINDLREGTFYANLVLVPKDNPQGPQRNVDCRPSDAIALAVQTGAPILVAREVFDALVEG
jgi:hypothetical protein